VSFATVPSSGSGYLPSLATGEQDCTSTAMDVIVGDDIALSSYEAKWRVDYIRLLFSNSTARDYSVNIKNGRRVVAGLNDTFYVEINDGTLPQSVILSPGFYTGTELAVELESQLNNIPAYDGLGRIFGVTYSELLESFTIESLWAPGDLMRYVNDGSTAGYAFGFTAISTWASNAVSDTDCPRLDQEFVAFSGTGSTDLEHYNDDVHVLSFDQVIRIQSSVAALTASYEVSYDYEGVDDASLPRIYVSSYTETGFVVAYDNIPASLGFIEFSYIAS
jgi:hypothetical protein